MIPQGDESLSPITPFRRAILDLVHKFCYEGLPCTKYAAYRGREILLIPNDLPGLRSKCDGGVPWVFLQACVNAIIHAERRIELWELECPDLRADLQYLFDRKLVDSYRTWYQPLLGAFLNPFDSQEIVSEFVQRPDAPPNYQLRWIVTHCIDAAVGPDSRVSDQTFFKLTDRGLDIIHPLSLGNQARRASAVQKPKSGKAQGRPADTDAAKDAKWKQAWDTGRYKTKTDCARALGIDERELRLALDRERKRNRLGK